METYPIDFVITWVDGADREWIAEKSKYSGTKDVDAEISRYRDFGTLRYLLRSIEKFAPWVRKIFLVTNGQVPEWLSFENPKIRIVKHGDYMPQEYLPTFSSHPIEWNFHKIKDLSEHFVYFNDDLLLTDYVQPSDFFRKGLPLDTFGLGVVEPVQFFSYIQFNHMVLLNNRFDFREVLKKHWKKLLSLKNGKPAVRSLLLSKKRVFYGMYDTHLTMAFNKSMFEKVWEENAFEIDRTCKNKFRSQNDISIWVVRYYQMLNGAFFPRSNKFGKFLVVHDFIREEKVRKSVMKGKCKVICLNDNNWDFADFETERKAFDGIMNTILGEKCSFEK